MNPTDEQLAFVEYVGRFWEGFGQARTVGRILGWLMICEPPEQSSSDLAEALQISAGSVSTTTRQLIQLGLADRVTYPGDRASYFRLHDHVWIEVVRARIDGVRAWHEVAVAAEAVLPDKEPERITELAWMTEFMLREWPELMDRMQRELERRGGRS
jgi:DNA-binding transcriptional regulator GbsR (MarR family)